MTPRAHNRAPTVKPERTRKKMMTIENVSLRTEGSLKFALGQDAMTDMGGWRPPGMAKILISMRFGKDCGVI